jgi:outer membrane receptor protein involved in Fe transport
LEGTLSYTFQDAIKKGSDLPLTNSPKNLLQANLSVPLVKQKLYASVDLQSLGNRATLTGQYSGAYAVTNVTLFTRKIVKGWEASVSIYNIFNEKYADPAGNGLAEDVIFQDGRTARIKIGYAF